jgi:hypothetical protein
MRRVREAIKRRNFIVLLGILFAVGTALFVLLRAYPYV